MRLPNAQYEEIKKIVVDLFVRFDVSCVPISGFELAHKRGITVIPYSAITESKRPLFLKKSEDGFFIETNEGDFRIYFNDQKDYGRVNHTLLHEIGHIVLGHTEESELADAEASFFAKFALVPPVLVHKLELDNPTDIANIFNVSYEAAHYALSYYHKWLKYGSRHFTDYERTLLMLFQGIA